MFDTIFPAMFRDVETLGAGRAIAAPRGQRDIVELRLSEFTGCEASWPILGTTVIDIAYEAIVWSAEGEKLAQWNGQGQAFSADDIGRFGELSWDPELSHLNRLTSIAMREAAADFIINFESDPAVRAWLVNRDTLQ